MNRPENTLIKQVVEMDKILEFLESKLTPSIFILIIFFVSISALFKKEIFEYYKSLFVNKRTRLSSIICFVGIVAILVITCSLKFDWWQQLLFLVGIIILSFAPHFMTYVVNPVFLHNYLKFKKKRNLAIELKNDYEKIYKFAINTREKILFTFLMFDYCEISECNLRRVYKYFSVLDQDKLYGNEVVRFNELYGIILVSVGSLKLGMECLSKVDTFLARDRMAVAYELMDDKDKALEIMTELKEEALLKNLSFENKAMVFNDYARIFAATNGPVEALKYYKESLKYAKKSKQYALAYVIYSNIINTHLTNNEKDDGLRYFKEYLEFIEKQKNSIHKTLELCNIKMMVSRFTKNADLMNEAILAISTAIENCPIVERLSFMAQTMEIKAYYQLDITNEILKTIEYKEEINKLSIPVKAEVYARFERVLSLIGIPENSRFIPFKEMVDDYYEKQMYIDAALYADDIPSALVFEKNRWTFDKYIYLFRRGEMSVGDFKKRFNEIVQSYQENSLKFEEMIARLHFVKEMFYINNVVDANAIILKSKYEPFALENLKIIDEYLISTPYRKKIEWLIFEAFIFTFFCNDLMNCERIYKIFRNEHPDNRMINPQVNFEFLRVLRIYESGRFVIG